MDHVDDASTAGVPQQPRRLVTPPPPPPAPVRRRRPLRTAGVVVLVLAVVALAAVAGVQRSNLSATRHQLRSLQASATAEQAQLRSLQASATAQLGQLAKQLTAVRRSLTGLSGQLSATHAQLQAAQTRLAADEKQLNLTTAKLPPDLTALAAKVSPSVVVVSCTVGADTSTGTGFALDLPPASGYPTTIVTAEHVVDTCVDPAAQGVLSLSTGTATAATVTIRGADTDNDVAVLDTTMKLPALQPAPDDPQVGEFLMAVGDALGMIENNATTGTISSVYDTYVVDTAPISNGNSGGPVVDRSGQVVGIVDAAAVSTKDHPVTQNVNFSLRLSTLCRTLLSGPQCAGLH